MAGVESRVKNLRERARGECSPGPWRTTRGAGFGGPAASLVRPRAPFFFARAPEGALLHSLVRPRAPFDSLGGIVQMSARLKAIGLLLLGTFGALLSPLSGYAQLESVELSASEPEGYRELVNAAVAEYGLRHFAEARGLFSRAHALSPNARTLRGLGTTEFELRNYSESVSYLEQALASTVKPLDPSLRERTERVLARARAFVGRLQLHVQPSSSLAIVDGLPVRGAKEEIVLPVGDHVVELQAPGYLPEKRKLRVDGGDCKTLYIALTLQVDPAHASEQREPPRALRKNPWLWTGIALVAAGTAVGIGFALREPQPRYDGGSTNKVFQ